MISNQLLHLIPLCLLVCPDEFGAAYTPPSTSTSASKKIAINTYDMINQVLQYTGPLAVVYRDVCLEIGKTFQELFSSWKSKKVKLAKQASKIKITSKLAVTTSCIEHAERRAAISKETRKQLYLLQDSIGLLPVKFEMVLAMLGLVKEELFWYIRHYNAVGIKNRHYKTSLYTDSKVSELIFLMYKFTQLILDNQDIIQNYYLTLLKTEDLSALMLLKKTHVSLLGETGKNSLNKVIEALEAVNLDSVDECCQAVMTAWTEAEYSFSRLDFPFALKIGGCSDALSQVLSHIRIASSVPHVVHTYVSISALWFWKPKYISTFHSSLSVNPKHATLS